MAPELAKLTQLLTLNVGGEWTCTRRPMYFGVLVSWQGRRHSGHTSLSPLGLQAANQLDAKGAAALAPELGKLTQLLTLKLTSELVVCVAALVNNCAAVACCLSRCTRTCAITHPNCVGVALAGWQADNGVGDEGAAALAPSLAKMTQLQTLGLEGTWIPSPAPLLLWCAACWQGC